MTEAQQEALRRKLIAVFLYAHNKGKESASAQNTGSTAIESNISDEFEGWEGETTVQLENGQVWRQIDSRYEYHYAYRPWVLIYRSRGSFVMRVEGMKHAAMVEQIK